MYGKSSNLSRKKTTIFSESHYRNKSGRQRDRCSIQCIADGSCVSVNFKTSGIGKGRCELNDKTMEEISDGDGNTQNPEFDHLYITFKVRFT